MLENIRELAFNSEPDYGELISILESELLKI